MRFAALPRLQRRPAGEKVPEEGASLMCCWYKQ